MEIFLIFLTLLSLANAADWSYENPSSWASTYPLCGGKSQTPINIQSVATAACGSSTLNVAYLSDPIKTFTLVNDGHTVVFNIDFQLQTNKTLQWSTEPGVTYLFSSAHLHWGPLCGGGSEHLINGHRYAAELHVVHYNSKYKTLAEAAPKPDGLAVLGIMLELAEEANSVASGGRFKNQFADYLDEVAVPKSSFTIPDPNAFRTIRDLLKINVKNFYSYKGSLTTPPCYESVRWFVAADSIRIYPSELEKLLAIYPLTYRPIQQNNNRVPKEYRNGCMCRC